MRRFQLKLHSALMTIFRSNARGWWTEPSWYTYITYYILHKLYIYLSKLKTLQCCRVPYNKTHGEKVVPFFPNKFAFAQFSTKSCTVFSCLLSEAIARRLYPVISQTFTSVNFAVINLKLHYALMAIFRSNSKRAN